MKTGGPETLHQMAASLKRQGIEAYIVYFSGDIHCLYPKYANQVQIASEPEDAPENVIVVPEVHIEYLKRFKKARKVICWLSWNFYEQYTLKAMSEEWVRKKHIKIMKCAFKLGYCNTKKLLHLRYNPSPEELAGMNCFHLYNCEYIHQKLLAMIAEESDTHYYCGPIDVSFLNVEKEQILSRKEDVIAYNPKKSDPQYMELISQALKQKMPSIRIIKIENMQPDEVLSVMKRAKVYVDMGTFPGPERIPREAVSLYCNLVTSRSGAAANLFDVPIPEEYKFDITEQNVNAISDTIVQMIQAYEQYLPCFDVYREKVRKQYENIDADLYEVIQILQEKGTS